MAIVAEQAPEQAAEQLAGLAAGAEPGTRLGTKDELRALCGVSVGTFNEALRLVQALRAGGVPPQALALLPGEGELPLAALLASLPADMLVSVEAPSAAALAAASPGDYAARAGRAVRLLVG